MKIVTILGTRPEIIRLSLVIKLLDQHADHLLLDTGQNYDDRLSGLFYRELEVRKPDISLGIRAARFGEQVGQILCGVESVLQAQNPDRILILGDTNSGLAAIVARRLGIPVFHMEAGNRCYDFQVPEETNRRIIDHVSSVLMPYTSRSRENLIREGIPPEQIYVTGNPINEVIQHFNNKIAQSQILASLELKEKQFFLVTTHRAENVDVENRLRNVVEALALVHQQYGFPVIVSFHPRTRSKATQFGIDLDRPGLYFVDPLGFVDFIRLEQTAFCILTDSGTVQEEACILRVPNVTLRDVTERPETVECGSNILAGCSAGNILKAVNLVTSNPPNWPIPPEYLVSDVADTVARIMIGFRR